MIPTIYEIIGNFAFIIGIIFWGSIIYAVINRGSAYRSALENGRVRP
jgi:hypothetical protein